MTDLLTDCFIVSSNGHGEKATHSKHAYQPGDLVYLVRGEARSERTRETIEIGPDQHVYDPYAEFINHSFTPNLEVRGREMIAVEDISAGDELTFDYLKNESSIAAPFTCHETGRTVDSQGCAEVPGERREEGAFAEGGQSQPYS